MGMGRGERPARPARRLGVLAVYAAGLSAARAGRAKVYARLCGVGQRHTAELPATDPDPVVLRAAEASRTRSRRIGHRVPPLRSTSAALAVVSVVGAAACSSSASSAASSGATGGSTGPSACTASQLRVDVKPLPGAATGRTFMDVVLTDKSASSCTVTGSVKLTVADAAHQRIPVPSTVFPGTGAATVTVHPGGSAAEAVVYNSDGNPAPGQTVCAPPVAFYDITAPGTSTAVSVPIAGRLVCPHDSLTLSNLVPGDYSPPF